MSKILCFGDSNTYGYIPGGLGRYPKNRRYPGILAEQLGCDFPVWEDGVVGRTTLFEDLSRPGRRGLSDIAKSVRLANPDILILMLGTNDCKQCFRASATQIADGMLRLAQSARDEKRDIQIIFAAPAPLHAVVLEDSRDYDTVSFVTSRQLSDAYQRIALSEGFGFVDAARFAKTSPADGEHLTADGHRALASAMKKAVLAL